jgi:hypothetical protein
MTTSYPTGGNFASDFPEDSDKSNANSFDIRDHLDKLQPGKEKNKYICPVCGGQNLGIDPKTGKYRCFTSECASADIREAIRPLAEFLAERKGEQPAPQAKKPKAKKKEYPPVPIPIGAKLLRLPAPGQSPQPEQLAKDAPKRVPVTLYKLPTNTALLKTLCGINGQMQLSQRDATKPSASFT